MTFGPTIAERHGSCMFGNAARGDTILTARLSTLSRETPGLYGKDTEIMRSITRGAILAGTIAAVLAPAAAQAAPARVTTGLLGTYDFGRAAVIGQSGQQAGVWKSFSVRSGFAGDDLIVSHRARTAPRETETVVYTAAFNEVADAQAECNKVGADGVARKAWVSFRCQTGFVPSYTLIVR
ncbi:hypothetical protein QLQ12_35060 [Actinoplanes sp. NEAU-A12]|uniref:Subtilisin inhibitor domain-containing protein n=1 Tax=Actinoplanes sandaracinus TaxID=3045177 RepID=A0ABT6WVS9_9ACTN|nr:hypothetical protein [Actinoplanes sandaracinus]MDI6103848.1 hypothetical protein [Actinoplanes sandaracinus]